jgi:hypothetical protein
MEALAANRVSEPPKEGYWHEVRVAECERIPASVPLLTSTEEVEARREAWIFSPYLSHVFPSREGDDYVNLQAAIQHIRDGIRGTDLESSDTYRASRAYDPTGCQPVVATKPTKSSEDDKAVVIHLVRQGYRRTSVRKAQAEFGGSIGNCEGVGRRLLENRKIRDYKVHRGRLWILPLQNGHP